MGVYFMSGKLKAMDLTFAAMFVALMAIGANITSIAPFMVVGGVPITLQTFFALLAGAVLGSRLGAISMIVYTFVGLVGVPVFAQFKAGPSVLFAPTFGFIISYILTAYFVGKLVENKKTLGRFIFASLVGLVINYVLGTNLMYLAYKFWAAAPEGFTYKMAWMWMVLPLPKDIILAVCAGVLALRLERTVMSRTKLRQTKKTA
jgi:biotin transport system substrate-specific component